MSTFEQLRNTLGKTWDSLSEGWNALRKRANQALTRFNPLAKSGDVETWEDQIMRHSADWGLVAAEVQESDNHIQVRLEVPGMEVDNFDIDVIDNHLVVRGEKHVQHEQKQGRYHVMECAYGSFERAIPLPAEVDADGAEANYRRGVLSITLPKHQRARSRRININAG
ncbi:MAG: Hsp20/alpha crystallin family protein [Chromatiales bacterium]|jgi:HSP20 family protein